jgi:hypothetical protein
MNHTKTSFGSQSCFSKNIDSLRWASHDDR